MSNIEVKKLFEFRKGRYLPCGLNIIEQLWWRFVPGTVINVKWPKEAIVTSHEFFDGSKVETYSADPNDHYRPWLEANVGRQKWDWDWGMANNDVTENRLTIKIRRKYQNYATIALLKWS